MEVRARHKDKDKNNSELTKEQAKLIIECFEGLYGDEIYLPIVAMVRAKSILA
jgi:hypothetical protein